MSKKKINKRVVPKKASVPKKGNTEPLETKPAVQPANQAETVKLNSFFLNVESLDKLETGTSKIMLVVTDKKTEIGVDVDEASSKITLSLFNSGKESAKKQISLKDFAKLIQSIN